MKVNQNHYRRWYSDLVIPFFFFFNVSLEYPIMLTLPGILFNNSNTRNDIKLWEYNCSSGVLTAIELCLKQSIQLNFHKKKCHFIFKNKCSAQKPEFEKN